MGLPEVTGGYSTTVVLKKNWRDTDYTISGTTTEFCIPDHWVQAAVMVKIRTFKLNPDLFRTTF